MMKNADSVIPALSRNLVMLRYFQNAGIPHGVYPGPCLCMGKFLQGAGTTIVAQPRKSGLGDSSRLEVPLYDELGQVEAVKM